MKLALTETRLRLGSRSPWSRLGRVVADQHCFVPTPVLLEGSLVRIFLARVGSDGIGRLGYVDVDAADPTHLLRSSSHQLMELGAPGAFDDNGITPISVLSLGNGRLRMYYTGWQLSDKVRYFLFTGLAESDDGGETFRRVSEVPVLDRCDGEMTVRTATFVQLEDGLYKAWYIAGSRTIMLHGKQVPTYSLHYAESADGVSWPRGREIMRPVEPYEFGFGRPVIRRTGAGYEMWYSIRRTDVSYLIGYATSTDGVAWARHDEYGMNTAEPGAWDDEMVAFPGVIDTPHGTLMFYNGNGFGRTGFGVARLAG